LHTRFGVSLLLIAAFALPSDSNAQQTGQKLYRWVDKNGVVQYGDTIPPEYAATDRDVLNSRGVRVGFEEGEITPEERVILDQRKADEEARRAAQLEVVRRDRMLLAAYSTVSDIEDLRDRRIELLESQIKVTELYLGNLRKRLVVLQEEASAFRPYTTKPDAPQIPENLALDISRTAGSINTFEERLSRARADQRALRVSFDNDIERFKELKGG
jgi:uncharacterized protein DUF4124